MEPTIFERLFYFVMEHYIQVAVTVTILVMGKKYLIGTPCRITQKLRGQVVIITGANGGIGRETARKLAHLRATIVFACRSRERTQPEIAEIRSETNNVDLWFMELDLSDLDSVVRFVQTFKKKF
jgi:FlaA1/EpsC-like NDP-sugar epimerase